MDFISKTEGRTLAAARAIMPLCCLWMRGAAIPKASVGSYPKGVTSSNNWVPSSRSDGQNLL
jgi:hypothetical protein